MMVVDYDKILLLYLERMSGTISEEDAAFLDTQLSTDAELRAVWEQIEAECAADDLRSFVHNLAPGQSLGEVKERLQLNQTQTPHRHGGVRRLFIRISVAAAVLLIFGAGWVYYSQHRKITDIQKIASLIGSEKQAVSLQLSSGKTVYLNNKSAQKIAVGKTVLDASRQKLQFLTAEDTTTNILNIPQGENYQIVLSDGTQVILNASSTLKFPFHFGTGTRDVYLTGEAFFKVAKDKEHPFIVHTPLTEVQVVGTQFNVNTYEPDKVSTALIEGKVLTKTAGGPELPLSPGHAAVYSAGTGFNIKSIDTDDVISWVNGVYYFHDLTLQSLAERMTRIYDVDVKIENAKLATKSVSGMMDRMKLAELLEDLKTTAGIRYYYAGEKLHIE